ncbi:MAG: IS1380 family transposase [Acidimicrobiales bacterium]
MQVSRGLDRVGVTFDDERLVANAGLIAPASLAEHLELKKLFDERVDLGDAPGRANVGHKAMTVIHAVLAGAEFIDGCDVLRAGSTAAVLGHAVAAPSTIGTFLRSFSWPHARQLDKVAGEALCRAWAAGAGPDRSEAFSIDVDSSIHETYGTQKEGGSRFGYTQVRGYHPLYALAGEDGEVLHSRLRGGNSHTARGAPGFVKETFGRVRAAGVSGRLNMRADSGFYSKKVVQTCQDAGAGFSITVKLYNNVHAAISTIHDEAWQPIPYWLEDGAEVAAIPWQAFKTKTDPGIACRLVVRRVRPTPGSQLALLVDWSYHAFIADIDGDAVTLDAWHRAHANCENAIRDLKYGVGLNHLPSGRFGANAAWLALNVIAHNLSRWTVRIGGADIIEPTNRQAAASVEQPSGQTPTQPPDPARKSFVATDTLRRRYLAIPGRLATSARKLSLHLPARWPWAEAFDTMLDNIRAVQLIT